MSSISKIHQEAPEQNASAASSLNLAEKTLEAIQILVEWELENVKAVWETLKEAKTTGKQRSDQKRIKKELEKVQENLQSAENALAEQIKTTVQALDPENRQSAVNQIKQARKLQLFVGMNKPKFR